MAVVIVAAMVGCSKESEVALNEAGYDRAEQSSSGSFDVGTVGANGVAVITYDMLELTELVACAVSEASATSLVIEYVSSVGYYLSGVGVSAGSNTTFSIELTNDNGTLSWEDNAVIFTCETTSTTPCDLDVVSAQTYDCSNSAGSCGQTVIGGDNGSAYASCNWPWKVIGKTKN